MAAAAATAAPAWAQPEAVTLSADVLAAGEPLTEGWRYHPGDDPSWASPGLDDSGWERIDSGLSADAMPAGWPGIGWFRLRLSLDPELEGAEVAFEIDQEGASEVYLDGRLLAAAGTVGASQEGEQAYWFPDFPRILDLDPGGVHVLAVRYSNHAGHQKHRGQGFFLSLKRLGDALAQRERMVLAKTQEAMFVAGAGAAFAILHLMLFLFFPRSRANLYYAVFTGAIAGLY